MSDQTCYVYETFTNLDRDGRLDGFEPHHSLVFGYRGFIEGRYTHPMQAADILFDRHNRHDRPDGKFAPSMSVGDVIRFLDTSTGVVTFLACDRSGWSEIMVLTIPERIRTWMEIYA